MNLLSKISASLFLFAFLCIAGISCTLNKNHSHSTSLLPVNQLRSIQKFQTGVKPGLSDSSNQIAQNKNMPSANNKVKFLSNNILPTSGKSPDQIKDKLYSGKHLIHPGINWLKSPGDTLQQQKGTDTIAKNPFAGTSLTFFIFAVVSTILFVNVAMMMGLEAATIIALIFFLYALALLFLILAIIIRKKDYARSRTTAYFLAWFSLLLLSELPVMFIFEPFGGLYVIAAALFTILIIYFILWMNHLGENIQASERKHKWMQVLLCIGWIAALLAAVLLYQTVITWIIPLIAFAFLFTFWLKRLTPRDKETTFFVGFILASLLGLILTFNIGLSFLFAFGIAIGFLVLWIIHLKNWAKG